MVCHAPKTVLILIRPTICYMCGIRFLSYLFVHMWKENACTCKINVALIINLPIHPDHPEASLARPLPATGPQGHQGPEVKVAPSSPSPSHPGGHGETLPRVPLLPQGLEATLSAAAHAPRPPGQAEVPPSGAPWVLGGRPRLWRRRYQVKHDLKKTIYRNYIHRYKTITITHVLIECPGLKENRKRLSIGNTLYTALEPN